MPEIRCATALALAAFALGCRLAEPEQPPDIVLITIDTLRADHLGAYGYDRPTSPALDRLAREGVLFENAHSPSSWTRPAVASLFTSLWPSEHGATAFERPLRAGVATLAELLRNAGYRTVGVSGNFVHVSEPAGLARGFDDWFALSKATRGEGNAIFTDADPAGTPVYRRAPDASELNAAVLERVPPAGDAPLFLYVHYMDPHSAYSPPSEHRARFARDPGYRADDFASSSLLKSLARGEVELSDRDRRWLIDLYDAEIASVDAAIEELLEALAARGYGSDSVICVVSDHGEEFGEHGGWFHGISLHAESLRVPLILRDPRSGRRGERREEPVDLIDVATTLLRRAGVEPTAGMRGRDLLSANLAPRDLVAELHHDPPFEENVAPREQRLAVLRWPWKTIRSRTSAAANYRVDHDPHETRPLDAALPADLVAHTERLASHLDALEDVSPQRLDAETLEGLRALGYAD